MQYDGVRNSPMMLLGSLFMLTVKQRQHYIDRIRILPNDLENCVAGLTPEQLTAVSIEGEWTVAQNIHHVADSHMNSYIRFKLILTEEHPILKPYDQDVWAAMGDAETADLEASLSVIRGLHERWVAMLEAIPEATWQKTGYHPEIGDVTLDDLLSTYGQHGHGHIDQINKTLAAAG